MEYNQFFKLYSEPEVTLSDFVSLTLCSPELEENKENQKSEENTKPAMTNPDLDEEQREREFWNTPCPFTPESRLEAHRHLEEKRKAKDKYVPLTIILLTLDVFDVIISFYLNSPHAGSTQCTLPYYETYSQRVWSVTAVYYFGHWMLL